MTVTTEQQESAVVVVTSVETLDASNAGEFKTALAKMIQPGARLVLDMSGIRFVDSSFVAVQCGRNGELLLVHGLRFFADNRKRDWSPAE